MPNPGGCPARWPPDGHWCEHAAGHPHVGDVHHDIVDWAGPWLRWCDYPLTCTRLDCDLSAASASRDARIQRASNSGYMALDHAAGKHADGPYQNCQPCGTYRSEP